MESMRPIRPIPPVVAYLGGKRKLAPKILPFIEAVPHRCYVEPFVGMGGLFFSRRFEPKVEVVNDVNRDVATFFRILQRHYQPFLDHLRFQITTRAEFERLSAVDPSTLTDIERAARFLYLQACSFGGKAAGRSFGVDRHSFSGFSLSRLEPLLEAAHERLDRVVIEALPYGDIFDRYDGEETLFYLDPPYLGGEADYGAGVFDRSDFAVIAERLRTLRGRFVLSINDTPLVREIFEGMDFHPVTATYTVAKGETVRAPELIVVGPPGRAWQLNGVQQSFFEE